MQNISTSKRNYQLMTTQTNESKTILVVDRNHKLFQALKIIFKDEGYDIQKVSRGDLAIRSASINPPDLILMNTRLKDMSGFEACISLKLGGLTSGIPIIMMGDDCKGINVEHAQRCGAVDFIEKPYDAQKIIHKVNQQMKVSTKGWWLYEGLQNMSNPPKRKSGYFANASAQRLGYQMDVAHT